MIGCDKATGHNCNSEAPCCENPMQPTWGVWLSRKYIAVERERYGKLRGAAAKDKAKLFSQLWESDPNMESDPNKYNPWFAPGHAPVANPCGILGGWRYSSARDYIAGPGSGYAKNLNHTGTPTNTALPPANMSTPAGTKGTDVLLYDLNMRMQEAQGKPYRTNDNAKWKAGGVQDVSYALVANHGGGVQYRLCKLENLFSGSMTEECFQSMPLEFVGDTSWFEYGNSNSSDENSSDKTRIPFTAVRVNDANTGGVLPKGSTWTRVGLPECENNRMTDGWTSDKSCAKPQFENELTKAGFWGFGNDIAGNSPALKKVLGNYAIVDKVRVPEGLDGDYVVSWRWDSLETAQVWTQCSVVTIEA